VQTESTTSPKAISP